MAEVLRCNICGQSIESDKAAYHSSTPKHEHEKSELETELRQIKQRHYENGNSVVSEWRGEID